MRLFGSDVREDCAGMLIFFEKWGGLQLTRRFYALSMNKQHANGQRQANIWANHLFLTYRFGFDKFTFWLLGRSGRGGGSWELLLLQIMMLMVLMMRLRNGAQRMLHVHGRLVLNWNHSITGTSRIVWSDRGESISTNGKWKLEAFFHVGFRRTFPENSKSINKHHQIVLNHVTYFVNRLGISIDSSASKNSSEPSDEDSEMAPLRFAIIIVFRIRYCASDCNNYKGVLSLLPMLRSRGNIFCCYIGEMTTRSLCSRNLVGGENTSITHEARYSTDLWR